MAVEDEYVGWVVGRWMGGGSCGVLVVVQKSCIMVFKGRSS